MAVAAGASPSFSFDSSTTGGGSCCYVSPLDAAATAWGAASVVPLVSSGGAEAGCDAATGATFVVSSTGFYCPSSYYC